MTCVSKNKALSAWVQQSLPRWKAHLATPNAWLIPAGGLPSMLQHLHCTTEDAGMSERRSDTLRITGVGRRG